VSQVFPEPFEDIEFFCYTYDVLKVREGELVIPGAWLEGRVIDVDL
jgi:hypothetical protein